MKPMNVLSQELSVALAAVEVNLSVRCVARHCGLVPLVPVQSLCPFPATIEPTKYSSSDIPGRSGKEKRTQKMSLL